MRRLLTRVALAVVTAAAFGACDVDVDVIVDAHADGRGEIRVTAVLDEEAAAEAGDLAVRLRTDDLEDAGWVIDAPVTRDDGSVAVAARHEVVSPEHAEQLLAQLAGADGPFDALRVEQDRSFFRTTTTFHGVVDLTEGIGAFTDQPLRDALGGEPLGVPAAELERRTGTTFAEAFTLGFDVRLPGGRARWDAPLGQRTVMDTTAARWNLANVTLLGVALTATVALAATLYRRRRRTPRSLDGRGVETD